MKPKIHCDLCGDGPGRWAITILCWAKENMYFGVDKFIWRQILSFSMHELPMKQLERDRRLRYDGGARVELLPIMFEGHYFSEFLFFLCHRCFSSKSVLSVQELECCEKSRLVVFQTIVSNKELSMLMYIICMAEAIGSGPVS